MRQRRHTNRFVRLSAIATSVAVAVVGVFALPSPSAASTPLVTASFPTDNVHRVITQLTNQQLTAGTSVYITGQYYATGKFNPADDRLLQAGQVTCTDGSRTYESAYSTTNRFAGSASGAVSMRWLFAVPTTASYTCAVMGWGAPHVPTAQEALVVSADATKTFLRVATRPSIGADWQDTTSSVGIAPGSYAYILRKTWPPAGQVSKLRAVTVMADVEISVDYATLKQWTKVTTILRVIQGGNTPCQEIDITRGPVILDAATHHMKFVMTANSVRVNPTCAATWAIKVQVINASGGVHITVNDKLYSNAIAVWGAQP